MATTTFVDKETVIEADWLNDVDEHVYDQTTGLHTAANITNVHSGNLAATDVQSALNELQTGIDGAATYEALDSAGDVGFASSQVPEGAKVVRNLATVAAMVAETGVVVGDYVSVQDYASGTTSGVLFFKAVTAATGTADGGSYIDSTGSSVQFKQNFPSILSVKMFGATGDGTTDDTTALQASLDYVHASTIGGLYVPAGTYLTGKLEWPGNNITLRGAGSAYSYNTSATPRSILKAKAATTIVLDLVQTGTAEDRTGNHIVDIGVDGNSIAAVGIDVAGSNVLEQCRVKGCTTAGVRLSNYTNGTRIVRCGLNSNSGWGIQVEGSSTTTYSVTDTNTSLNTAGGINIQGGVLVNFKNVISESNTGPGLRIYKPNTHTNAFEGFTFDNCWFEDNASASPYFTIVIDADTADPDAGPQRISFNQCRTTASAATRKYANLNVGRWVEFNKCQFDNSTEANAVTMSSNMHYVSFIESTQATGSDGLTATQVDNAIAQGTNCWWHDPGVKRVVGAGSPAAGFTNSWVNYGSGFVPAAYWFDRDGRICIEGVVKTGTPPASIFTLPTGYRPSYNYAFAQDAAGSHSLLYVNSDGTIVPNVGSTSFQSIDGICIAKG